MSPATGVTTSPALQLLAGSLLVFVLYWLYARVHFIRDPGSVFYDESRAFDRFYLSTRLQEAQYLLTLPAAKTSKLKEVAASRGEYDPCLCATVVTVQRNVPRSYVFDTIGSMLVNLTTAERASLNLNVLFADVDPSQHEAFHDNQFSALVDNTFTYQTLNVSQDKQDELSQMLMQGRTREKSTYDYTTALQVCLDQSTCPHIAVFEGDVVLADSWLVRTHTSLRKLSSQDWLDLRLFNEEGSIGWASKKIGHNKEPIISLGIALGVLLFAFVLRRFFPPFQRILTRGVLIVTCCFIVPVAVVLFYQSGKASLLPPRPGVHLQQLFGCCSQALVFNRKHVPGLINYLREQIASPLQYDMLTRDYAWHNNIERAAQYPVMAQHVGITSSQISKTSTIWSMAFEQLDQDELARSHTRLHSAVFGPGLPMVAYYE